MKLDYLEMLHAEFEVSSLNSMAVREIIRWANWTVRSLENANWQECGINVYNQAPDKVFHFPTMSVITGC